MCLDYHQTSFHTSLIWCIAHFFIEVRDEWIFCDGFNIGFIIFSIEDTFHSFCFSIERCVVLLYRKHIFCCGIYVAPRDGGIVPVNGHIAPMDVNAKGSDKITTNNHIITVDVEVDYVERLIN